MALRTVDWLLSQLPKGRDKLPTNQPLQVVFDHATDYKLLMRLLNDSDGHTTPLRKNGVLHEVAAALKHSGTLGQTQVEFLVELFAAGCDHAKREQLGRLEVREFDIEIDEVLNCAALHAEERSLR